MGLHCTAMPQELIGRTISPPGFSAITETAGSGGYFITPSQDGRDITKPTHMIWAHMRHLSLLALQTYYGTVGSNRRDGVRDCFKR